ncbi:MAG TPA: T9SS type A sorting domain-containing protein [Flavobacterium sp.]|uniref:T9SS-dependent choice-of-anchor J family protein n=1 Tax=Flavobacterium sp. TaxID=239 RepID=UPI002C3F76BB|nr:T9SS type A sorting domain-containing protein [Flavobacterium sp.]HNP33173.1 T9SS type A sorting domain-containing protein [Flavobacterium sp.]
MKKITLLIVILLASFSIQAQSDIYNALTQNGGTSQNGRAPQGARPAGRSVWLITPTEMAASGMPAGHVVSLGFLYSVAHNAGITGTITIYLQNTTNTTNTKSTTWATAITGMTMVSTGAVTLPSTTGTFDIPFVGGTWFDYTGGGLYVAFDYQNFSNPVATTASTALCNTDLTGGIIGAMAAAGATTPPTTLTASAFRPHTRLGIQVSCARPTNLSANNATFSTADLSFTNTGGTTDLEYGAYGYTQGSGTTLTNVTSPYTLNGLSPSSVYDFYVKSNCGAGNSSIWNGPYAFNTLFTTVDPTYIESFEQDILPFVGWLAIPDNTADSWFINNGLAQDGSFTTASIAPTAAAADARMFSRGVNLVAGATVDVSFYIENFVSSSTNTGNYELTYGNAQTAASQTTVVGSETGISNATYVQKTYSFTAPSTGTFYFAFHNTSPLNAAGTHALLVDNFVVTQTLKNNEYLASKLNVYPNPAKNVINFSNDVNAVVSRIEMTDLNGRVVKTESVNATSGQVSISDLSTGVYMMKIITDQGLAVKKIVKE